MSILTITTTVSYFSLFLAEKKCDFRMVVLDLVTYDVMWYEMFDFIIIPQSQISYDALAMGKTRQN